MAEHAPDDNSVLVANCCSFEEATSLSVRWFWDFAIDIKNFWGANGL